jgi:pyruvate dehydrogenase (quinone)
MADANPVNPQRVFWELSPRLPERCIIAADSGTSVGWYARDLKLKRGMLASVSGTLSSMGCAVPYAFAAKMAYPGRVVIACAGDGAMLMNGINELITIAQEWRKWSDPRLIVLVLANHDLNMVTWEQRVTEGDPKFPSSQDVPDFGFAQYARMLGLEGIRVDRPEDVGPAWDRALSATRPVVYEAVVDPEVPMLPPHITVEQAKNFLSTILSGDPSTGAMIRGSVKDALASFLPGAKD